MNCVNCGTTCPDPDRDYCSDTCEVEAMEEEYNPWTEYANQEVRGILKEVGHV